MVKALNQNEQKQTLTRADDVVLSVNGVSKKFCRDLKRSLLYGVQDITADLVGLRRESDCLRPKEFWALQNVSFQLRRGEALGLVGKNGSGKSTLLRVIAGLIKPDAGSVDVCGRIAPLIALSAGFNPILTGRENIYANMSILGLSQKEIDERFDQVVEFAEIGDAIDAPVQTYSSGMAARLGFSCAVHTEPEILLIDEVLAVGDVKFRVKCARKLYELREKGIALILVSHNQDALTTICESGLYLSKGICIEYNDIRLVMDKYEHDLFVGSKKLNGQLKIQQTEQNSDLIIQSISLLNDKDKITGSVLSGKSAKLSFVLKVNKFIEKAWINIQIDSGELGQVLYISSIDDGLFLDVSPGYHKVEMLMPALTLGPGNYALKILIRSQDGNYLDRIDSFEFSVLKQEQNSYSKFFQPRSWAIISSDKT